MKKVFSILLVLTLLMGVPMGFVFAEDNLELLPDDQDYEVECLAAPAVAGLILEEAGIDNRYGSGKDGGNFIKDVAQQMSNGALFPAYEWDGYWDGEAFVDKCDVEAYYRAVYNYLAKNGAELNVGLTTLVISNPADTYTCEIITDGNSGYPTAKVVDQHGQPVPGIKVRASLISVVDFQIVTTDDFGLAVFDALSYDTPGEYTMRYWVYDTDLRNPPYSNPLAGTFTITQKVNPDASSAVFTDNGDGTGTLNIKVLDGCGNVIEGLDMDDISIEMPYGIGTSTLAEYDSQGYWTMELIELDNGMYKVLITRDGSIPYNRDWWNVIVDNTIIGSDSVSFTYDPVLFEARLESVVYDGSEASFGSDIVETLTLTFSKDIDFSETTSTTYGVELWFVGDPNRLGSNRDYMTYEISNNVLTITSLKIFSDKRPDVGDVVDHIIGLVDSLGNPVVVPDGITVTK